MRAFDINTPYNNVMADKLNEITVRSQNNGTLTSFILVVVIFFTFSALLIDHNSFNINTASFSLAIQSSMDIIALFIFIISLFITHERVLTPFITRVLLKSTLKHSPENINDYAFTSMENSKEIKRLAGGSSHSPARSYILNMPTERLLLNIEYHELKHNLSIR